LPVRHFEKARAFYEQILGFSLSHLDEKNKWCLYHIPGSSTGVALYNQPEHAIPPAADSIRLVVRVEDLDRVLSTLAERGITVEPVRIHKNEHFRISGFTDPDGHLWRVWSDIPPDPDEGQTLIQTNGNP